jgi:hypothetical protein
MVDEERPPSPRQTSAQSASRPRAIRDRLTRLRLEGEKVGGAGLELADGGVT